MGIKLGHYQKTNIDPGLLDDSTIEDFTALQTYEDVNTEDHKYNLKCLRYGLLYLTVAGIIFSQSCSIIVKVRRRLNAKRKAYH